LARTAAARRTITLRKSPALTKPVCGAIGARAAGVRPVARRERHSGQA